MTALGQGGRGTAAAFMRQALAQTENYGKAALLDYQRGQLEHLLRFAQAQAPFYKERLAPLFRKDGALDWTRWHDIPILTRADIKQSGAAMMAKELPKGHGLAHAEVSSGTTGSPVTVHCSTITQIAGNAAFARACRWYGHIPSDRFCITFAESELEALDRRIWTVGTDWPNGLEAGNTPNRLAVAWSWRPERILSLMERHGSTCFSGTSAALEDVAEAQFEHRANIHMKFMVGFSMAITERARGLVRDAFNARAYSVYTSKEAHKIAHECPASGGFHVNSELVRMEILDNAGKPCGPGETGRVIVTPLLGTAQPLIRYEQGDLATWGGPCPCGRAHPIIARIEGRMRNRFCFGNGRKFLPAMGYMHYRDLLKADRWQVAQTGSLDIEVRFISQAPDENIDFAGLTKLYQKAFHHHLNVTYRRVSAMPLTAAGKFMDYVNEYEA